MSEIVKYKYTLGNLPPLTEAQKQELENLRNLPDEEIDLSDIPELTDEFWQKAMRNPFYRPKKASTTVRIDVDVLNWLKSQGKGYQTRINQILRNAMLESLHTSSQELSVHEPAATYKAKREK